MLIIALTVFATCMGVFAPTLVNLYLQWAKEPSAPSLLRIHPYLVPMLICIGVLLLAMAFLIYAGIREYGIQKRKRLEEGNLKADFEKLEERLTSIEEKINK